MMSELCITRWAKPHTKSDVLQDRMSAHVKPMKRIAYPHG